MASPFGIHQRTGSRRADPPLGSQIWRVALILIGLAVEAIGLALLARVPSANLWVAIVMVGVGSGLMSPSTLGLLSRLTPPSEQGASLARSLRRKRSHAR